MQGLDVLSCISAGLVTLRRSTPSVGSRWYCTFSQDGTTKYCLPGHEFEAPTLLFAFEIYGVGFI